jgi:hypothetical protein
MAEETQAAATEEAAIPSFTDLLKNFEGSPDQAKIDGWKAQFGDVFCSAFSETELFIWRPLNRMEWREHQIAMSQAEGQLDPFALEEEMVAKCMLWMSGPGEKSLTLKAGSASTLHEQLLQNSNFVDPRLASNLVVKL